MATTYHPETNYFPEDRPVMKAKASLWTVPIARFFYAIIFLISGFNHFTSGSISYAASQGIPMADVLVPVSGLLIIIGSLSIMLGIHARVGAVLILMFLVPVTILMHNFWAFADPEMAQMQMIHFMKNLSLIGGALLFAFYGAGPVSVDHHRSRKTRR
jgi:putative oxidoreductase